MTKDDVVIQIFVIGQSKSTLKRLWKFKGNTTTFESIGIFLKQMTKFKGISYILTYRGIFETNDKV